MGSASQPMLVVKANRVLLKKRRSFSEIRESYVGYVQDSELKFKELTLFEQKKIRDKIIAQAKRDKIQEIKHYVYAFITLIFIVLILSSFFR